ncbi:hypothetical protein [Actinophytocola sp.]|uniref:hypothetical protein n=1 Tax=Actinophytocola sp. TaxID=1872138 RepID=UPI002ED2292F
MDTLVRPAEAERRPRLSLLVLRILVTAYLVAVLGQPVLAGLFLTGDVDAISVHAAVGSALAAFGMVLIAASLVYVLRRGRLWVLPAMVVLFLSVGLQVGMGYARTLQIHIPLGVAIVTSVVLLAIWVWSPSAARPRGGAR